MIQLKYGDKITHRVKMKDDSVLEITYMVVKVIDERNYEVRCIGAYEVSEPRAKGEFPKNRSI